MSQFPPPPAGYQSPMQQEQPNAPRSNGFAIASLICGILGCFGITGIMAIVFGILGIKRSKQPMTGGKGLSIAGIILGILGIIGMAGLIGTTIWGYGFAKERLLNPTNQVAGSFLTSLVNGDTATARTYTTGSLSQQELTDLSTKLKGMGKFKDLDLTQFNNRQSAGNTMHISIGGTANLDNGSKIFNADISGDITNPTSFKIEDFELE